MHLLRSTYLPAYQSLIRPPYTSDPFPTTSHHTPAANPNPSSSTTSLSSASSSSAAAPQPIASIQRETLILDRFIALKVREDVFADDSELHLEREDMFKDLFDHAQPKARLEDLVRRYGVREGVISVPGGGSGNGGAAQQRGEGGGASAKSSPAQSTSNLLSPTNNTPTPPPLPPLSPVRPLPSPNSASRTSKFFNFFSSAKPSVLPTPYPPPPPSPSTPTTIYQPRKKIKPIPFASISISLAPRTINLVVGSGTGRRTLVSVQREGREMKLESGARRLVRELKELLGSMAEE
ncbi:hypothetical protein NP233_g4235 [Leucocoprinus birnbaumii]|uniref:Uncharacterized protein n=1 Tax=Leucocoprinus birnbaumii TaxID=56174 RepID=A0AAD5VV20_9AGAR|nr:hypothetical protein NP233_g4235 [Leucocoprinus birnbaumii]